MRQVPDEALLPLLRTGLDNIRSSYALAQELGVKQRGIGFMVNRLRQDGYLIGSKASHGYYLIRTEAELQDTLAHIEQRKAGIDKTINALQGTWDQLKLQGAHLAAHPS